MLKNVRLAACGAMTLTATLGLSAQAPVQPPTTRPPAPTQPSARVDRVAIAVTGCLKPWDNTMGTPSADSIAASPGSTPMAGTRYVLLDVETDKPGDTPADRPAPTPPPAVAAGHPQLAQFIVIAGAGVDLAAHVNHKVRLMGTVDPEPAPSSSVATPAPRPGDPPAPVVPKPASQAAAEKKWATLTATSVTMVSTTCTTSAQ